MIRYLRFKNFYSIKDECILEFDKNINETPEFIARPTIGFAGANASGKTNALKAITFLSWFMKESFKDIEENEEIPFEPFARTKNMETEFYIEFSIKEKRWIKYYYELRIKAHNVIFEKLEFSPKGRKKLIFERNKGDVEFGNSISKINTKDLRNNCSFVSYAKQFSSQLQIRFISNHVLQSNVFMSGFRERSFDIGVIESLIEDPKIKEQAINLLKIADIGIKDFSITQAKDLKKIAANLLKKDSVEKILPAKDVKILREIVKDSKKSVPTILSFNHDIEGKSVDFDDKSESAGTLQFLCLLEKVLYALKLGRALIVDEIELKLHQDLVAYIIGLFQNPKENIYGAQLIFSFHNSMFMNILGPEELWFAEKDSRGRTELFSAIQFSDIKDIKRKNLEKLYRIGRFGAIPKLV